MVCWNRNPVEMTMHNQTETVNRNLNFADEGHGRKGDVGE